MKSGFYLHSLNPECTREFLLSYGVQKKINAQIKSLTPFFNIKEKIVYQRRNSFFSRIFSRLPFTAISEKWKFSEEFLNIDFVYFRKNIIDYSVYSFFKTIKKKNPKCKIILEIPTLPYDLEEFKSFKDLPFKLKDRINRKRLYKCVDLVTTFTNNDKSFYGIDILHLMNGIDCKSVPINTSFGSENEINIVVTSLFSHWHGYDRLIEGFKNYNLNNSKRIVNLHLVGEGVALSEYKEKVKKYNLKNIYFYGNLHGKELDDVFNKCNIACDSLGLHRLGLVESSTLKSREYCARGLPIITSSDIDFISDDFNYILKLPSTDESVDVNEIIKFYDKITSKRNSFSISKEIRNFALKSVDMSITMKPVIDYLMEDKK